MSKSLLVSKLENEALSLDYTQLRDTFVSLPRYSISECPWPAEYPYIPAVSFQIAHTVDTIALHYTVAEEYLRAHAMRTNENVWEDSCVEFFISLDNKKTYYNFEFNILGTGLIGFGPASKADRTRLEAAEIHKVKTITQVVCDEKIKKWEIFLLIPKTLLTTEDLSGKTVHGNFYKCGDGLPTPHFIAWNTIESPKPNFHLPEFFGELNFG